MKKLCTQVFATVVFFVFASTVGAQQTQMPTASERSQKLTDWMKTNLSLTDEQVPKVQDINLKYANKMDELKSSSMGKRQKMSALKSDDAAKDAELKGVLTDSQYQTYLSKKNEMKKKFKEKMKEKRQG